MQSEQRLVDALPRALDRKASSLEDYSVRLDAAASRMLRPHEAMVSSMAATLDALSPLKVLGRGYAIARDEAGHVVTDASSLAVGDSVSVRVGVGSFEASVTGTCD